jgi:hypothetical protein
VPWLQNCAWHSAVHNQNTDNDTTIKGLLFSQHKLFQLQACLVQAQQTKGITHSEHDNTSRGLLSSQHKLQACLVQSQ